LGNIAEKGEHIGPEQESDMARTPNGKAPLPPYFNIDPKAAADKLSAPIDTARFSKAAAFAAR